MNNFQSLERDCVRSAYTTDMDACKKAGVAEPTWKSEGGFVIVTFQRPNDTQDGTQGDTQGGTKSGICSTITRV